MDSSRALNALEPSLALCKSANSPAAAAQIITQATSTANTYVFAELLQQPNIQKLAADEQYRGHYELLKIFAWGTWQSYKATPGLPALSEAQATKLRLLSLLTIASQKSSETSNLSYQSLCQHLDLSAPADLEHLITEALYSNLITGTLNPSAQTVTITSVAPLRDLSPGSIPKLIAQLAVWSGRCDSVLSDLEAEIKRVKADAEKRAKREAKVEEQTKAMEKASEKAGGGGSNAMSAGGRTTRGSAIKRDSADDDYGDDEMMDLDDGSKSSGAGGAGRKKSGGGGGISGAFSRLTRGSSGRS